MTQYLSGGILMAASLSFYLFAQSLAQEANPKQQSLAEIIKSSDRTLRCYRNGKYSLGILNIMGGKSDLMQFTLEELNDFLHNERHKDCLVLWLDKGIAPEDDTEVEEFCDGMFKKFVAYRYNRIMLISSAGDGLNLLAEFVAKKVSTAHPYSQDSSDDKGVPLGDEHVTPLPNVHRPDANSGDPSRGKAPPSGNGEAPNNRRSAPLQPPEGPPPAKPGSAPQSRPQACRNAPCLPPLGLVTCAG